MRGIVTTVGACRARAGVRRAPGDRSPVARARRVLGVLALGVLGAGSALAAPQPDLWPRWTAHDSSSTERIDHGTWSELLAKYVRVDSRGLHRLAYAEVTEADARALDAYLERLAATPISGFSKDEQRAYWINLYNALTIDVVLAHYPVDSIRDIDISPGWFSSGPWDEPLVTIEDQPVTLNDIEHRILRPIWQDPRIHYAVNCASVGCPNLRKTAFTAQNTEELLEKSARDYVNDPRGAVIEDGRLVVSSIYVWFQRDFGGSDIGVITHLRSHARPELEEQLAALQSIYDHRYDWSLNDWKSRPTP